MRPVKIFAFVSLLIMVSCQVPVESPAYLRDFRTTTTSAEVVSFSQKAANRSSIIDLEIIGSSHDGKPIVALKIADPARSGEFPLKVLVFAQQHGNEQSGKEAALLLISDFARNRHTELLSGLELWIVPQVNPWGSDTNYRRNAAGLDLNRDHIVLQAPETQALHNLFNRELPHVTVDIHEYQPFRESWEQFGGFKTFDVQVGVPTNPNVNQAIRDFTLGRALPVIENHLNRKGFSFHNYLVGPVPTEGRTRHSTVDLDDGRHSFAIQGTLAFIYEGINGRDGYIESLERRTFGQYEALIALLRYLSKNALEARNISQLARQELLAAQPGQNVAIRMEHFPGDAPLLLPLTSSKTGADTLVVVENFHPVVKTTYSVTRPLAYLLPASDTLLNEIIGKHGIITNPGFDLKDKSITAYQVKSLQKGLTEEDSTRLAETVRIHLDHGSINFDEYVIIPSAQLKADFLVTVLEPGSMLGLAQRQGFEYLLQEGKIYPIFRVE